MGERVDGRSAECFTGMRTFHSDITRVREEAIRQRRDIWLERLKQPDLRADRDALLKVALDAAISIASADFGHIQMWGSSRRNLVIVAQRGFSQPLLDFFGAAAGTDAACRAALHRCAPVVVEDITNSPIFASRRTLEVMLTGRVRAAISLPLVNPAGTVPGFLSVHYRQPHAFDAAVVAHLVALSSTVTQLMDFHVRAATLGGCAPVIAEAQ